MKQTILFYASILTFWISSLLSADPFDDAASLWHFADLTETNLQLEGNVRVAIPVDDSSSYESHQCGSDGLVADFSQGGSLAVKLKNDSSIDTCGNDFTWYLRVRDPSGEWNSPILSYYSHDKRPVCCIFGTEDAIRVEIATTLNNRFLYGDSPFNEMRNDSARNDWHDLVLRFNRFKMQWFVDGRCYDEDFVLGEALEGEGPLLFGACFDKEGNICDGFRGQIDTAAFWNRLLTDEEIMSLTGGTGKADLRPMTDLGDGVNLQYWSPPNHFNVGDCMPFYADGVFHFMYLIDKGHHSSKNGLGGHQWIQATSRDLVHWTHQPFVLEFTDIKEGSFCTGSVFYYGGTYYAYYANRSYTITDGKISNFGQLAMATSKDGIHFEKTGVEPLFTLPEDYAVTVRDPVVFQDTRTKKFHMYLTTSHRGIGCWAQMVSDDLYHWNLAEPIYARRRVPVPEDVPLWAQEPECPDWFQWGNRYYTITNISTAFWLWSDSPTGPWDIPNVPNELMPGMIKVPKTAPFGNDRRLICGWTKEKGWGGQAVFHELVHHNDGTLGEKFVPEMIPQTGAPIVHEENFNDDERHWKIPYTNIIVRTQISYPPEKRDQIRDLYFRFVNDDVLNISPRTRSVSTRDFTLSQVDFSTGKFELTLVIKGNIADMEINGDRTLTLTFPEMKERELILQTDQEKNWTVEFFEVFPLKEGENE